MTRQPLEIAREPRRPSWWRILAWTTAIVLVVAGFAALALFVFLTSAASHIGSNK
jgi:hypothetical protein